ncbi:hypothetical protein [Streptomyces sp. NPDC058867]|uniref:hypothetical protein n=1 Tax=Streptomyces sp. NPDC058867 TaxID=3346657 RepID=UPI00368CE65C
MREFPYGPMRLLGVAHSTGHAATRTVGTLVVVIAFVVLLTGGQPPARHTTPSTAAIAAKLAIGVAPVLYGAHRHRRPPRPHGPPRWASGWTTPPRSWQPVRPG